MGCALLFDAHVENHLALIAADRFEMRLDHAGHKVDALLSVALGPRQQVALAHRESLPHLGFGNFMDSVKIDDTDTRPLGGSGASQESGQEDDVPQLPV